MHIPRLNVNIISDHAQANGFEPRSLIFAREFPQSAYVAGKTVAWLEYEHFNHKRQEIMSGITTRYLWRKGNSEIYSYVKDKMSGTHINSQVVTAQFLGCRPLCEP